MTYTAQLETIPGGAPGLALKARRMRGMVERAKRDPRFRSHVADLLRDLPEKDHQGEIHRLIDFVRTNVRYMRDPWSPGGLELFTDPRTLLRDVFRGTASGDCDDHVILASALLETAGYETRYPVGAAGPEDYRHIWIEVLNPSTGWITADLTTKEQEIGWDPGPDYHHVEIHDGKGDPMLGDYHAPRALPPSFHNRYAEPGVYVGSTPSDFFRAVAMRGQLPEGNAWAMLGSGHDPGQLGGWFSDVGKKLSGYAQTYGPAAAGLATTVFAGPAAGGAVFGLTSALTAEAPEVQQVAQEPVPPKLTLIGDADLGNSARSALKMMGITDAQIDQAIAPIRQPTATQVSTQPIGPPPAPSSSGVLAPSPRPLGPGQVETSPWAGAGPGPGAGGGFNPLWLALGAAALFLLRRR